MEQYHKINSIFKRDMEKPNHPFIMGKFSNDAVRYLANNDWEWTEKVDGTNIRVLFDGENIEFRGKSDNAQIPAHLYKKLQTTFLNEDMLNKLKETFDKPACLYGEGFGYKIQGKIGVDYLKDDVDFYLFDIKIGDYWLSRESVQSLAEKLGLIPPFVVACGTIFEAIRYVEKGFRSHFGNAQAEGLVLRPIEELYSKTGRIITKIKSVDFY